MQVSFVPQRERTYRMQLPIVVKALAGPAPDFRDAGQIGTPSSHHTHQTRLTIRHTLQLFLIDGKRKRG